jgi:gliding motility-associated-like protein
MSKTYFTIVFWVYWACMALSQNLLHNGDFEQYNVCPVSNADFCTYWEQIEISNTISSSTTRACAYYNTCAADTHHPLLNNFGYQKPHSGKGFVSVNVGAFYQELAQPLIAGRFYTLSLFVNIPNNRPCVLNQYSRIGLYTSSSPMPAIYQNDTGNNHTFQQFSGFSPTVVSNKVIEDTTNWVQISDCFRAQGDEKYITVALSSFDEHKSCPIIYNFVYFVDDVTLTLNPNPDTIQVETTICADTKLVLNVTQTLTDIPGSAINCFWQDGATTGCDRVIQEPGVYLATVHTNCESKSVQFHVTEEICACAFYTPNVIRVDQSGVNDTFQPQFACQNATIQDYQLRIFDRWGNLLFSTNDLSRSWDGRYKGQTVDGLVAWIIQYELSGSSVSVQKQYTGDVLILR